MTPSAPYYDYDDVDFVKPHYVTAGQALVNDFVRGHEAGADLPENWLHDRPSCADTDPSVFYPGKGDHWAATTAKRICSFCPCIQECREHGADERFGVWGGLSERERRAIRPRSKPGRKPKRSVS